MPPRCGRWDGSPLAAFWASSAANSSLLSSALTATGWGAGAANRGSLRCLSMVSTAAEAVGLFSLTDSVAVARADSEVCGVACELPATGGAEGTAAGAAGGAGTGGGCSGRWRERCRRNRRRRSRFWGNFVLGYFFLLGGDRDADRSHGRWRGCGGNRRRGDLLLHNRRGGRHYGRGWNRGRRGSFRRFLGDQFLFDRLFGGHDRLRRFRWRAGDRLRRFGRSNHRGLSRRRGCDWFSFPPALCG